MRLLITLLLVCNSLIVCSAELNVASAANFYPTLKKIKAEFEKVTEHKIIIIRGSTGKLYAQIMHGAPFDVFLSADSARADKIVANNKSLDGNSEIYAIGQLALWAKDAESSQSIKEKLIEGKFDKLAIANPKTAPYGKAAIQTLKEMELYELVKKKLIYGENISQTLQFVESGGAGIGFVARSHVHDDIYWEVDDYRHSAINQKMVILKQSRKIEVAKQFFDFMKSSSIQNIIVSDGYKVSEENR